GLGGSSRAGRFAAAQDGAAGADEAHGGGRRGDAGAGGGAAGGVGEATDAAAGADGRRVHGVPGADRAGAASEKKSLIAAEQGRPDVAETRRNFAIARRFVPVESLVFLDESGVTTHMTRL